MPKPATPDHRQLALFDREVRRTSSTHMRVVPWVPSCGALSTDPVHTTNDPELVDCVACEALEVNPITSKPPLSKSTRAMADALERAHANLFRRSGARRR